MPSPFTHPALGCVKCQIISPHPPPPIQCDSMQSNARMTIKDNAWLFVLYFPPHNYEILNLISVTVVTSECRMWQLRFENWNKTFRNENNCWESAANLSQINYRLKRVRNKKPCEWLCCAAKLAQISSPRNPPLTPNYPPPLPSTPPHPLYSPTQSQLSRCIWPGTPFTPHPPPPTPCN